VPHILVVDPEPAIRSLIALALHRKGLSVLTAADPGEAIEVSHSRRGQIVLLIADALFAEMDGETLKKAIAVDQPGIGVIFMSARHAPREADESVALLAKPFSIDALLARVRAQMGQTTLV
jgi:DNA-binding response OmpR family regulator